MQTTNNEIYVIFCNDGYTRQAPCFSEAIVVSHVNNIERTDAMIAGLGCECGDTSHIIRCYKYNVSFVVSHQNKCESCAGSGDIWYAGDSRRKICSECNGTGEKKQ